MSNPMKRDRVQIVLWIVTAIAFALLLAMALAGCKTPQPIVQEVEREVIRETTRTDTLVTIEPDTASLHALLRCDSAGQVLIAQLTEEQGRRLAIEARLRDTDKGTVIEIDCKQDSLQRLVAKLKESIIMSDNRKRTETVTLEVVPTYYRNCTRGFWVLLSAIAIAVAVVVWKNWKTIAAWVLKIAGKFM